MHSKIDRSGDPCRRDCDVTTVAFSQPAVLHFCLEASMVGATMVVQRLVDL